jgi:hypothetical protein
MTVPINGQSFVFGDNQSVVNYSAITHSCLRKRLNALPCHQVCEEIVTKVVNYFWVTDKITQLILLANVGRIPRYGIFCKQFSSTQEIQRNSAKTITSPNLVKIGMAEVQKMEKWKCNKKVCFWSFRTNNSKTDICVPSWHVRPALTGKISRWYPHN